MIWETVRLAIQAIFRNTLRSILTVLGIVIGVAAVIAMVTVGQGSSDQVTADVEKLGTNVLMVMPGAGQMGPGNNSVSAALTLADVEALIDQISSIRTAAPYNQTTLNAVYGAEDTRTSVAGTDARYLDVVDWPIVLGRSFLAAEESSGKAVCILGESVRQDLFGNTNPIGETVRLKAVSCEVIGLLEAKGASSFGTDQDDIVLMPIKAFQRRVSGSSDVSMIYVTVADSVSTDRAVVEVEALMRERRRIGDNEEDDFNVRDMKQLASMLTGITDVLTGLLSAVAAVSLLVGGIGIMNIMLVSVTERTREIGIRLAVGATGQQVLLQFLVEAIVLSMIGGLVGILLGLGLAALASNFMSIPFSPDPVIVAIAFLFSAAVGVIFGYFPARRAARLDPIEALRHQ
ncbi:ABC transporter permease [Celeribacter marinus]|uniref:Macrolide export ATP-binding/permease protein MacB n=1 Tax=Celeribacter marinus TaxID=1397108 RepID=A0A0N9ZGJ6_9RHOB|nr:ABC transporter permease [Celeribacter marinus]ALI54904.1 macrolide export ATP-binding/permease protein MacB [Celeribacter marinus]SFK01494.1 putative ABC transport system permease protein [Celeribacter marinus]